MGGVNSLSEFGMRPMILVNHCVLCSWAVLAGWGIPLSGEETFGLDEMQTRLPQPPANHITEVNFLNGRWIIGDERGNISHSEDGISWSTVSTPYTKSIEDLAFYNDLYLAAGADNRTLLLSSDLVNWELYRPDGFPFNPDHFFEMNGDLYMVGSSDALSRSTNLLDWEDIETGELTRAEGMAWNGNLYVMVGSQGEILTSPDTVEWTEQQADIPGVEGLGDSFLCVHYFGDQFLAGGKEGSLMSSPDGIDWMLVATPTEDWFFTIVKFNDVFVFPGRQGTLHVTQDLVDWEAIDTGLNDTINDIHVSGDTLMAVGRGGNIALTTDLEEWELPVDEGQRTTIFSLVYWNDRYYALNGEGVVLASNDTEAWLPVYDIPNDASGSELKSFNGGLVVLSRQGELYFSADGVDWEPVAGPGGRTTRMRVIQDMLWVVGDDGIISRSGTDFQWELVHEGEASLADIARGPDGYMAVGRQGALLWSANGTDWETVDIEETRNLNTAVYFNGSYYAFGFISIMWKSPNGADWTRFDGFPYPANAQDAWIVEDSLVLPGYLGDVDLTNDGAEWERFSLPVTQQLYDLIITDDRTVVVGSGGSILSSPSNLGPGFAAWRNLRFNVLQLLDETVSSIGADPDEDGRSNLVEYFCNSQPLIYDESPAFEFFIDESEGALFPAFRFLRSLGASDVRLRFESSADAVVWEDESTTDSLFGGIAVESAQPLDAERESVTVRFGAALDSINGGFLRPALTLGTDEGE